MKRITKTVKNETKEQRRGFLGILLGTIRDSLLRNMFTGIAISGNGNKEGKEMLRAGYGSKMDFQYCLIFWQILKYKNIIKMNLDLME